MQVHQQSAIEALLSKRIDAAYFGPKPAINGYVVPNGEILKIIANSTIRGEIFVVRDDSGIESIEDFCG